MAHNNKTKPKPSTMIPVNVPEDLHSRIITCAASSRLSQQDIMRMAIDRGLAQVEKLFQLQEAKPA